MKLTSDRLERLEKENEELKARLVGRLGTAVEGLNGRLDQLPEVLKGFLKGMGKDGYVRLIKDSHVR